MYTIVRKCKMKKKKASWFKIPIRAVQTKSSYLWSAMENIILPYLEELFTVLFSRLRTETEIMDHICSLPQGYGIQMKFNSAPAQGEKQWH